MEKISDVNCDGYIGYHIGHIDIFIYLR